jgi:hypothetical protein
VQDGKGWDAFCANYGRDRIHDILVKYLALPIEHESNAKRIIGTLNTAAIIYTCFIVDF